MGKGKGLPWASFAIIKKLLKWGKGKGCCQIIRRNGDVRGGGDFRLINITNLLLLGQIRDLWVKATNVESSSSKLISIVCIWR